MSEWTPHERRIETAYGPVFYGGPCRDDYPNMVEYDQPPEGSGLILVLQRPAMRAFWSAEARYGRWSKRPSGTRPILVLPGTNRSCETQRRLYASDPGRYARPEITGHTRGLAIDVSQAQGAENLKAIRRALLAEGWRQVRADEPWHYSYGVTI